MLLKWDLDQTFPCGSALSARVSATGRSWLAGSNRLGPGDEWYLGGADCSVGIGDREIAAASGAWAALEIQHRLGASAAVAFAEGALLRDMDGDAAIPAIVPRWIRPGAVLIARRSHRPSRIRLARPRRLARRPDPSAHLTKLVNLLGISTMGLTTRQSTHGEGEAPAEPLVALPARRLAGASPSPCLDAPPIPQVCYGACRTAPPPSIANWSYWVL